MALVPWLTTVPEQASPGPARSTCPLCHQPAGLGARWGNLFSGGAYEGERPIHRHGRYVQILHFSELFLSSVPICWTEVGPQTQARQDG